MVFFNGRKILECLILFIINLFFISTLHSANLKKEMLSLAQSMEELMPLISSYEKFILEKNAAQIEKNLKELQKKFDEAGPHWKKYSEVHRVSAELIAAQVAESLESFQNKRKAYSMDLLKSLPSICAHCHSLDGRKAVLYQGLSRKNFSSDLEYAEFNFMTRNTQEALKYYDSYILSTKGERDYLEIEQLLMKELSILLMNEGHLDKAYQRLSKFVLLPDLPPSLKAKVLEWIEAISHWPKGPLSKILKDEKLSLEQKLDKVSPHLGDSESFVVEGAQRVHFLLLGRFLYQNLQNLKDESQVPILLYWLSFVERKLHHTHMYSFSDLYLKECMEKYFRHPYAKKCYFEYRNSMIFSFTGSGGTSLPSDIREKLFEYRKKIFGSHSSPQKKKK